MIGTTALRVLDVGDVGDLDAVHAVLDRDPVSNVFVSSRVRLGLERSRMGGELWGWVVDGRLDALCFAGANLVPVEAGPEAIACLRRPRPPPGPPVLLDRRTGGDGGAAVATPGAELGTRSCRPQPTAGDGHRP